MAIKIRKYIVKNKKMIMVAVIALVAIDMLVPVASFTQDHCGYEFARYSILFGGLKPYNSIKSGEKQFHEEFPDFRGGCPNIRFNGLFLL